MPAIDVTPATAIDQTDPGDEVQRRFRYQINYCALKALQLLAEDTEVQAIYCEQIEDVLVEFCDGRFCGVQVKTRELDQDPIKASDEIVINALARFCIRDAQYPGHFAFFVLATNFVFQRGGADDIRTMLQCACDNPGLNGLSNRNVVKKNVRSIVARSRLPIESVIATLTKIRLEERKTGIDQPDLEVVHAIGQIDHYSTYPHARLMAASRLLKSRIWDASSLAVDGVVLELHQITGNFDEHLAKLRIACKRIDASEIAALLVSPSHSEVDIELLSIANFLRRQQIPPGLGRMEFKMAAGAISYSDIEQTKDDVASLERAFLRWTEKYGIHEANQRLAHLQYFALRDARIELQNTERADQPYGQAMLQALRHRLTQTATAEATSLFGCRAEHLLGAAGLVTDECKLWWGKPVSIGETDVNPS
jgi:Cap4 dsDNA endonuclease